jgi:hypothetical protein
MYKLSIQGDLTAGHVRITGGQVTTFTGVSKFDVLELVNVGYSVTSSAQFGNVTGNGTITLSSTTAHVQAAVYDENINFYLTWGSLVLSGSNCGQILMNQYQGSPSVSFTSNNFLVHNATLIGGSLFGTSAYFNYLAVANVNVQSLKLYLLRELNVPAGGGYNIINLSSGTFVINPKAIICLSSSFYVQGYGSLVNEGDVYVNSPAGFVTSYGVVVSGNGNWTASGSAYISFEQPSNIG